VENAIETNSEVKKGTDDGDAAPEYRSNPLL